MSPHRPAGVQESLDTVQSCEIDFRSPSEFPVSAHTIQRLAKNDMDNSHPPLPERTAWILTGLGLLFVLGLKLVPGLLAGMLLFSLLHRMDIQLRRWRLASGRRSRFLALGLLGSFGLILAGGIVLALAYLWKARATALPELYGEIAQALDNARNRFGQQWVSTELTGIDGLREKVAQIVKQHATDLKTAGGHAGRTFVHILAGLVVGVLIAFHHPESDEPRPLTAALCKQIRRLFSAFEGVVYAQVKISAINTCFSAIYLYALLPLCHIHLPLRFTLVVITFLAGLVPILGNVFSNTLVVLLSFGAGPGVALASLVYLVVIHKLEYFLNAHIVGQQIHSRAWEVLIAMLFMETAFGLPGLVMAPILYAYLKGELREHRWI